MDSPRRGEFELESDRRDNPLDGKSVTLLRALRPDVGGLSDFES